MKAGSPNVQTKVNDIKNFMACKRSTIYKDYIVKQNNNSSFGNERTAGGLLIAVGDRTERQDR